MPFDVERIKNETNLLDLVGGDTTLRGGAEKEGPCPKCGGDDRFHCTAEWWFCRQCYPPDNGEPHDAISYLQWRDGLDFAEACQALGGQDSGTYRDAPRRGETYHSAPPRRSSVLKETESPGDLWQERARIFCSWAEGQLWGSPEALAYLCDRGLSDESIKAAGLGYNPRELYDDPQRWGANFGRGKVWLPRGWVIPCEVEGILRYVKIRRVSGDLEAAAEWNDAHPDAARPRLTDKYIAIKGSKVGGAIYGLDDLQGHGECVICESELDTLLLRQFLGEIVGIAGLPGANARPGADTYMALGPMSAIHVCFDLDKAGDEAREWWGQFSGKVRQLVPLEHDVTDTWEAGHDLAAWAVPLLGPRDPEHRTAWARHYLDGIPDGPDDTTPEARLWLALYAELGKAEEKVTICTSDTRGDLQKNAEGCIPGPGTPAPDESEHASRGPETPAQRLARWNEGLWMETSAPEDVPEWIAAGHRFYRRGDGRLVSVPRGDACTDSVRR